MIADKERSECGKVRLPLKPQLLYVGRLDSISPSEHQEFILMLSAQVQDPSFLSRIGIMR